MAESSSEQDKSESATPYKLQRARQRGVIARGRDLGFASTLIAFVIAIETQGTLLTEKFKQLTRTSFLHLANSAGDPATVSHEAGKLAKDLAAGLGLPALIMISICILAEIIQNRGINFSAEPLKPDFSRLNPAAGLKKLFSSQMLFEALKSVVKFAIYTSASYLFLMNTVTNLLQRSRDGIQFSNLLEDTAGKLLLMFILLATAMAGIDQLLARRLFAKQMRMSRREVTRESREREGEPRIKKKRRQILTEIIKQARGATDVKGADILITNPTHYAVALQYRPDEMDAPIVHARGRNFWALRMRDAARREGITIVAHPSLARALYREGKIGKPIGPGQFVAVADIYISLRRNSRLQGTSR